MRFVPNEVSSRWKIMKNTARAMKALACAMKNGACAMKTVARNL
jgi:hypothetical protein